MRHSCRRFTAVNHRQAHLPNPHKSSAIAALTLGLTAVLQTPVTRATALYKCAPTDERLGMNGGDPVCRLFRLSLSGFRSLLGLRCQPLGAELLKSLLRAFEAARHHHLGPIPWPQASRFRPIFQVLFCRGQSAFLPGSKCFFAGVKALFCRGPMLRAHARFLTTRARGVPLRSGRGGDGASPAAANKWATGSAWPMPSSTTKIPPGASRMGAAAAMAR
jgi:hypothetical protein